MREEFERRAIRALMSVPEHVWDRRSLPIPVERIATDVFCLRVCRKDPLEMRAAPGLPPLGPDESLSGLLLVDRGEIWVNATEAEASAGRARFTICHEIGHWVMHRNRLGETLYCRSASITHGEQESSGGPGPPSAEIDIEEEAHMFAAAMLMPMPFVRREYERYRRSGEQFFDLCRRFGASGSAMGRRLHQVIPAGTSPREPAGT